MATQGVDDPVGNDEWLMRRVPAVCFNAARSPESPLGVTFVAFRPTAEDTTGLSLSRARSARHADFLTPSDFIRVHCSEKPPDKRFYVAFILAFDLADPHGLALTLKPDGLRHDPGHLLVPGLHAGLDKPTRTSYATSIARERCRHIVGPFSTGGIETGEQVAWRRGTGASWE